MNEGFYRMWLTVLLVTSESVLQFIAMSTISS